MFDKVVIIGLGLIGGSLAKTCKKNKIAKKIIGFDADKNQENFALSNQIINDLYHDQKISDDDLVIIATPLSCYKEIFTKIKPAISKCLVIDIGSVKNFAIELAAEILQEKAENFVACHPIAGSEKSGVSNSDVDLFFGKKVIICENKTNNKNAVKKAELFWQKVGCNVEFIDPKEHDKIFALVSHLPQFLAFVAKENIEDEILKKHLRLQNSNPKIWQEIFALNRVNIEYYLEVYLKNLNELIGTIHNDSGLPRRLTAPRNDDFLKHRHCEELLLRGNPETVLRRFLLVSCLLNIPDIEKFKQHAGSGFKDFTDISCPLNPEILKSHQQSLIQFLETIKLKISNYVFI